jgi:hypothetical protein
MVVVVGAVRSAIEIGFLQIGLKIHSGGNLRVPPDLPLGGVPRVIWDLRCLRILGDLTVLRYPATGGLRGH